MSTVTSRDGTIIGYTRSGSGPALILVDGALCYRAFGPMPGLAAPLDNDFTVYMYDRRGRGESSDTQPYAIEREIEDIAALIEAAGGSACVHGQSSGAVLALMAASKLPTITKVSAYEPPLAVDASQPVTVENYLEQLDALLAENRRGDAVELFMRLVGSPAEMIAGMRQSPAWPTFESIAPTLHYDGLIVENPALRQSLPPAFVAELASLKAPTLVMAGGASPDWMRNAAQAITTATPGAQYRMLAGQTHQVEPEALAPVLTGFFKGAGH